MGVWGKSVSTCNDTVVGRTSCPPCGGGLVFPPDEGPERMISVCVCFICSSLRIHCTLFYVLGGWYVWITLIGHPSSLVSGWVWSIIRGEWGGRKSLQADCVSRHCPSDFYVSFFFWVPVTALSHHVLAVDGNSPSIVTSPVLEHGALVFLCLCPRLYK